MKIFVVEDEAEICKELSVLLQKYGYAYESGTDFAHITEHILKAEADCNVFGISYLFYGDSVANGAAL